VEEGQMRDGTIGLQDIKVRSPHFESMFLGHKLGYRDVIWYEHRSETWFEVTLPGTHMFNVEHVGLDLQLHLMPFG
jgi:hypothetical protein